ncbi:hypothetical protein N7388_15510 [Stutzerimonas stutzeri]|nr:hypothetical protein [Stutzerimonas stutzeri]MDH0445068.1 hypothetical protein [Stutzerimonas stutzeri]
MSDKKSKPTSVPVMNRKTGTQEMLQPAKRQEAQAQKPVPAFAETVAVASESVTAMPLAEVRDAAVESAQETAGKSKAKDKEQQKIESLADFLAHFYAGKTKSLSDTTLRKVAQKARIEEVQRFELLALAQESDPTLEKSFNLMLLAADLNGYRGVEEQVRFFAAEVGRRVNGQGKYSLESWLPRTADDGLSLEAMASEFREAMEKVAAPEVPGPDKKKAQKRLECGFYLACQWRLYQGAAPRELVGVLRRSLLAPRLLQRERKDGLVRLFASQPFADAPGLAWLLDDQARQVQQADARADQLEREMRQLAAAKSLAEERLKQCEAELAEKTARLNELQAQLDAAQEQSRIQEVHSNDDLSRLRGQVLRVLNSELPILQDVLIALDRDPPKVAVAREYLGSVVEKLNKEISRIKER